MEKDILLIALLFGFLILNLCSLLISRFDICVLVAVLDIGLMIFLYWLTRDSCLEYEIFVKKLGNPTNSGWDVVE